MLHRSSTLPPRSQNRPGRHRLWSACPGPLAYRSCEWPSRKSTWPLPHTISIRPRTATRGEVLHLAA
eukprot:6633011-Alexandrium_andersonii.AAC.1